MQEIVLYTDTITPRLVYIARFVLERVLGYRLRITSNRLEFEQSPLPGISYSTTRLGKGFWIKPAFLLQEHGIRPIDPLVGTWEDVPSLFASAEGDLPLDIFSAGFYLISRYEEYLPFEADVHGRFEANQSIAFASRFLHLPLVDIWSVKMAEKLRKIYPSLAVPEIKHTLQPTVDVDMAWKYRQKGFARWMGGFAREAMLVDLWEITNRIQVTRRLKEDPFFTFDQFDHMHQQAHLSPKWFVPVAQRGEHDKNPHPGNNAYHKLIRRLDNTGEVGLHPSYAAGKDPGLLKHEVGLLSGILGRNIRVSRQHYLLFRFPSSARALLEAGIHEDYTMGYATQAGFRASTAYPFEFYDLEKEEITSLVFRPFQIMDRTLAGYLGLGSQQAIQIASEMASTIKKTGGALVPIWHNETLAEEGMFERYGEVYESILKSLTK
jgi:hypothetical protein